MEYVYAALILHEGGKDITADGIVNILKAAGLDVDETMAKAVAGALSKVDIEEVKNKSIAMPVTTAAPAAEAPAEAKEEKPKEEKKKEEEKKEEEAVAGLASLFG
ncbi:MAG: 50S ribosomal protein P1 [Candidatus Njordarchaeia archaeon]